MSPATPKKTSSKVSKDGSKAPPSSMMVKSAIRKLAERKGSSLAAIKKYISAHYKVDMVKRAPFICKAIRSAVEKGELVQTKGKGASGTFKLPVAKKSKDTKTDVMPKSTKKSTVKKASKAKAPVKKTPKKKTVKSKTPKKATKSKAKSPKKSPTKKAVSKASVKKTTKRTASKKA